MAGDAACDTVHLDVIVAAYVFKLLSHEGYRPDLSSCVLCGDTALSHFSAAAGGLLCASCAASVPGADELDANQVRWLQVVARAALRRACECAHRCHDCDVFACARACVGCHASRRSPARAGVHAGALRLPAFCVTFALETGQRLSVCKKSSQSPDFLYGRGARRRFRALWDAR